MLRNYIKTSIRILIRQKGYSVINILGLSIGLTASILILLYILHETSYDSFHENVENIYRVNVKGELSGEILDVATSMAPIGIAAKKEIPEVKNYTRLKKGMENVLLSFKHKKFYEEEIVYADTNFFDVFSFKLLRGDPKTVLSVPYSMVVTEDVAKKFFGNEDPVGNIIIWNNEEEYTITGVVENAPSNSHLDYHILASFSTLYDSMHFFLENWGSLGSYTYLELVDNANISEVNSKLLALVKKYFGLEIEEYGVKLIPFLQPIANIHLHSDLMAEFKTNSDITNIYIFSAVAFFILIIAGINFMNLSTARAQSRRIEVGIRKTLGAQKNMLIFQFLIEAVLLSIFSLIIAIFITELALPVFNNLTGKNFGINYIEDWYFLGIFIGMTVLVGIFSGSYPAFYLSNFIPVVVLKGKSKTTSKRGFLRYFLVLSQFVISIILIISTITIYKQLQFVQNKKLGFNKENLISIPLRSKELREKAAIIKSKLLKIPEVTNITGSAFVISRNMDGSGYFPEGYDDAQIFMNNQVDYDYIKTMQMNIVEGRNFSAEFLSDTSSILINETAAKKIGWEFPVGMIIERPWINDSLRKFEVIGVIKDYHIESFHNKIPKVIIHLDENNANYLTVRFIPSNIKRTIKQIKLMWKEIDPSRPFDFFFLDQSYEKQYISDIQFGKLIIYFTILAIFIACLGLLGLSSFTAVQRTKEIGIRKVMGSSTNNIVFLLVKEFAKWVLYANIIAWPISYYLLNKWLENFEYKISVPFVSFIAASLLAFIIAMLTVSYQAIKASLANPVDSLKYE